MIHLQICTVLEKNIPQQIQIQSWVEQSLSVLKRSGDLTIRFVDSEEAVELNQKFRHKSYSSNVLSFPNDVSLPGEEPYIGDIVICSPVVEQEAQQQNKSVQAHYAHLIIHGVLHLLGYDHLQDEEANEMEQLEISMLHRLGFADPYQALSL